MGLIISTEEKNALIQCQSDIRYKYTLKRIADTETLWLKTKTRFPFNTMEK